MGGGRPLRLFGDDERAAKPSASPAPPTVWPRAAPSSFHLLAKPTGALCNLDCDYCFFLSKEALYPGSRFRMEDDLVELYIKQLLEAQRAPEVTIAWQGGEPTLMGLDFFARAVALAERHRPPGTRVRHTVQTNGVLLDDNWCEFLKAHGFLVGLSLDGPRALHDAYRKDKGGKGTFDKVRHAAHRLQAHGVETNFLCTVHTMNASRPLEVYRFFRDELEASFLQFIPIVERCTDAPLPPANEGWSQRRGHRRPDTQAGNLVTQRSVQPEAWGHFLVTVFDEWFKQDVGKMFVQIFEASLASWLELPSSVCIFAETCGDALALEHNGDVYSCDHFVDPEHKLGNLKEHHLLELVASEPQRAFGRNKRDGLPRACRECDVRFACHGECPKNRFLETPDGESGLNYLCAGYKTYFHHIDRPMRALAALVRSGQDPSDAWRLLRAEDRHKRAARRRRKLR